MDDATAEWTDRLHGTRGMADGSKHGPADSIARDRLAIRRTIMAPLMVPFLCSSFGPFAKSGVREI